MIKNTSSDYAQYMKQDLSEKLRPIENSIDDMLIRLEEFESMVALVQQERGNVIGLTGTLTKVADGKQEFDKLCSKVDTIGSMMTKIKDTMDSLEDQIQVAEEQYGLADTNTLKNFFIPKMFKKTEAKTSSPKEKVTVLKIEEYFTASNFDEDLNN